MVRRMWIVAAVTVGALAVWTAWWWGASAAKERAIAAAIDAAERDGWRVEVGKIAVGGYPYRFDTEFRALQVAAPGGAIGWDAPWFRLSALAYNPAHLIAMWPERQAVRLGATRVALSAADMRASVVVGLAPGVPLRRAIWVTREATLDGPNLPVAGAAEARAAIREAPGGPASYDIGGEVLDLALGPATLARLPADGALPPTIARLHLDVGADLDRPLEAAAAGRPLPRPVRATLRDATLNWGPVTATVTGEATFDDRGRASGRLILDIENWPVLLSALRESGVLTDGQAEAAERAFAAVSTSDTDGAPRVRLPVTLDRGVAAIGPIVIGALPPWPAG